MLNDREYAQLKEVYNNILRAISLEDDYGEINTVGCLEVIFKKNKCVCVAVVCDMDMNVIEKKEDICKEPMTYSPKWASIRGGKPLIGIYSLLENKPDVILIEGVGAVNEKKVSVASYVGVMINKPTIAVSKRIIENDNIVLLNTREFANPVYISPGFRVNVDSAKEIVSKCLKGNKMPEPMHLAHKDIVKLKKKV